MCEVCGGDCKLCTGIPETVKLCCIGKSILNRIQDMGRVENMLKSILNDDVFANLSKHNPYYDSEYEVEADKLDDLRRKLSCINDNLWDVISILKKDEE